MSDDAAISADHRTSGKCYEEVAASIEVLCVRKQLSREQILPDRRQRRQQHSVSMLAMSRNAK